MKKRRKSRLLGILLSLNMILTMLPFVEPVSAAEPATAIQADGDLDMFGLPNDASQIENYGGTDHPYGRAGWFNINPVSELAVFASLDDDNRYRSYSFAHDNAGNLTNIKPQEIKVPKYDDASSKYRLSASDRGTREYRYAQSIAFDPGSTSKEEKPQGIGQDRYLASVAYNRDDKKMYLIVAKADNSGVPLIRKELTATGTGEDFGHISESDSVYSHRYRGTFSIAAGDFDGDGADSIVVYRPIMANEGEYTPVLTEYRYDPTNNSLTTNAGDLNVNLFGKDGMGPFDKNADADTPEMTNKDFFNSDNLKKRTRNTPIIQMTAEDTDRDGRDELVVTGGFSNVNGDADDVPQLGSQLLIYERSNDQKNPWMKSFQTGLSPDGSTKSQGRLRYAGVSVGSIITESTGTDFPEIITAGYVDNATNSGYDLKKDVDAYIYRCNGVGTNLIANYGFVQKEDVGLNPVGEKFSNKDDYLDPVQVTAFAAKGVEQAEYVMIEGMVWGYEHDEDAQETKFTKVFTPNLFHASEGNISGAIITHNNVQEAVAGNFDGNPDGREQVVGLLIYRQSGTTNNYYYKMVTLGLELGTNKDWQWKDSKNNTWHWFDTNPDGYELYQSGASTISLAATDVGRFADGTLGKIKSRVDNYTKPGVLAILEAAPYFKETNTGVRNGGTSYGIDVESGEAGSTINTVSANVLFGYEFESTGMGGGFEANFEHKSTWTTTKTTTTTFSTEHYNDSDENQVLVYRAPLSHYIYDTITPDGTKGQMNIVVQGAFATNMVPVETYNEAAAMYGLDPINEGIIGTAGVPDSYNKALPITSTKAFQASKTASYSSAGTVKQSVTYTQGQETSYEYSFGVSLQGYGLTGGVKFGGGAGYEHAKSNTKINTNSVTKEAAVSGRDKNVPDSYNFDWRFATWEIELNGSEVPILGYLVNNVTSPPSPPINLSITDETETTLTLNWDHSSNQAVKYNIYRYFPDSSQRPYVKVGSVNGAEREFIVTGLSAGTTYQYVIRAEGYVKGVSVESMTSDVAIGTTLDIGGARPKITGPYDTTASIGGSARFDVNVDLPDLYIRYEYVWQEKRPGDNWTNLTEGTDTYLELSPITAEHNGRQYRYVVTAFKSDGSPITYYSQAATLKIGRNQTRVSLGIQYTPSGGSGTIDDPYFVSVDGETVMGQPLASYFFPEVTVEGVTNEKCSIEFLNLDSGHSETKSYELSNGKVMTAWTKKEPGRFALTAYYPGSATQQPGYSNTLYFQFISLHQEPIYRLALSDGTGKTLPSTVTYGTTIADAKLYRRGVWWDTIHGLQHIQLYDEEEYYPNDLIFTDTFKETNTSSDAVTIEHPFGVERQDVYLPDNIGLHTIAAIEKGNTLASTVVQVTRRDVSIQPTWEGTLPPDKITDIDVEVVPGTLPMVTKDTLDKNWFTLQSSLYDENGNKRLDIDGNITVTLSLKNLPAEQQTDAYRKFVSNYRLLPRSHSTLIEKDSYNVRYEVAPGSEKKGTLEGRYGIDKTGFTSGVNLNKGEKLEFTARPERAYMVDQWMNNGVPITDKDPNFQISKDGKLTVYDLAAALNISVSFKRTDEILLYYQSANTNWGSVSAIYNNGTSDVAAANGDLIPKGSNVTLTAHPGADLTVDKWVVDGEEYVWEGTDTLYTENTLTLENYNKTSVVTVYFKLAQKHQLKVSAIYDNNWACDGRVTIRDYSGNIVKPGAVDAGKRLIFEASDLAEGAIFAWQSSTDGGETFKLIPDSMYQKQIVLPEGISTDTIVRAVYAYGKFASTITPEKARVPAGEQQQFTAHVEGNPAWEKQPPQEFIWRIEGANSKQTTISDTGLLSVGSDETADRMTVFAKSRWATNSAEAEAEVTTRDLEPPTGEIVHGENKWKQFLNNVSFGLFFKETQDISITAKDDSGEPVVIDYYLSDNELSEEEVAAITDWKAYEDVIHIEPNQAVIVYARLTDIYSNVSIINSEGIVVYTDSQADTPSITFNRSDIPSYADAKVQLNGNTIASISDERGVLRDDNVYYTILDGLLIRFENTYLRTLPAGTHELTVAYHPGGKDYVDAPGNEAPETTKIIINVLGKEQPQLNIEGLKDSYTYGDDSFTLNVSGGAGNGMVTLTSSNDEVASVSDYEVTLHKAGTFAITATKMAEGMYEQATTTSATIKVYEADPAISLQILPEYAEYGDDIQLEAAVAKVGTGAIPQGDVIFKEGTNILATIPLDEDGHASFLLEKPAAKAYDFTVEYTGQKDRYRNAACTVEDYRVHKTEQAELMIEDPGELTYGDDAFMLQATGGSGSGEITFSVPKDNGVLTVSEEGEATILGAGTVEVTAVKAGDETYEERQATLTIAVQLATPEIALSVGPEDVLYGDKIQMEAIISKVGTGTIPQGNVVFKEGDNILATVMLDQQGHAMYTLKGLNVGVYDFTAEYTGQKDHYQSTSDMVEGYKINKAEQADFLIKDPGELTYGDEAMHLQATGGSGTGDVIFSVPKDNGVLAVSEDGEVTILGAGSVNVTALKAQDQNYYEKSTTLEITVKEAVPVVTLSAGPEDAVYGDDILLETVVNKVGTGAIPQGDVIFKEGTNILATIPLDENGYASFLLKKPAAKTYDFVAEYMGQEGRYLKASGSVEGYEVGKAEQAELMIEDPGELTYGDDAFMLQATGGSGSGEITFSVPKDNGVLTVSEEGEVTILGAGTVEVTAVKAADSSYNEKAVTMDIVVNRKQIEVPKAYPGLIYNGKEQSGIQSKEGYQIINGTAINAGTYTAQAILDKNHVWVDDTVTEKAITFVIEPMAITVTADHQEKHIDEADPLLTWTASPALFEGDYLEGTLSYTGNDLGTYDIVEDVAFANPNYTITFVKGTMTIRPTKKVEYIIELILNLPDPVKNWEDADKVAEITNMVDDLSEKEKSQIMQDIWEKLKEAQRQSGEVNIINNYGKISMPTLPWYVRLIITQIPANDQAFISWQGKIKDKELVQLYDIYLINTLTKEKYLLSKEESVTIILTNTEGEDQVAYLHDDGNKTFMDAMNSDGNLSFTTTLLGQYGVMKDQKSSLSSQSNASGTAQTGDHTSQLPVVMLLLSLCGIICLVKKSRKSQTKQG